MHLDCSSLQCGVFPIRSAMMWNRSSSIASYQDRIFVITGNGFDSYQKKVPAPDAPSLICFDKHSGKVLWQDKSPGENLLDGQWSSPLVIEAGGRVQVITPQGDGWLRSFDARTGALIWKFDINQKAAIWKDSRALRRKPIRCASLHALHRWRIALEQQLSNRFRRKVRHLWFLRLSRGLRRYSALYSRRP